MAYYDYDEYCINGKLMHRVQPEGEWQVGRAPSDARSIRCEPPVEHRPVAAYQPTGSNDGALYAAVGLALVSSAIANI